MPRFSAGALAALLAGVSAAIGIYIFAALPFAGLDMLSNRILGLTVIVVALWVTGVVPPAVPSFVLFLGAMIFSLAPPAVAFAGFSAGAAWLTFTGIVFGLAIHRTGLGTRLANQMLPRFGRHYAGAVIGTVLAGFALCFVMPSSMGRCAILMPMILAMADALGFVPGRRGRIGLVMAGVHATVLSGYAVLPAGLPTLITAGAAESLYGIVFHFGPYMLFHLPSGLLTLATVTCLALLLFRDKAEGSALEQRELGPWKPEERRLALIVCTVLALWATDFLHGISPAWVGLGGAVVCVLPRIGALDAERIARECDYTPWIFTVGVISLGAIIAASGLAPAISKTLFSAIGFEPGADARNFAVILGIYNALAGVTTSAGVPPLVTPLAGDIAKAAGWPLMTVLLTQTAAQYVVFYPYQIPPILTGALLGRVSMRHTWIMGVCWSLIYLAVIAPVCFLWWRGLGMFGP
jgi:anion transporter